MDYSPPGSSVHGISQARILEWLAISFSRGSSWPGIKHESPALAGGYFLYDNILGCPKSSFEFSISYGENANALFGQPNTFKQQMQAFLRTTTVHGQGNPMIQTRQGGGGNDCLSNRTIKTLKVASRRTGGVLRMIGTSHKTNGGCPPRDELIQGTRAPSANFSRNSAPWAEP